MFGTGGVCSPITRDHHKSGVNFPNCPESLLRGAGWLWAGGGCVRAEHLGPWARMKYCALFYDSQCCKTKCTQLIHPVFSVNLFLTCFGGETILRNVISLGTNTIPSGYLDFANLHFRYRKWKWSPLCPLVNSMESLLSRLTEVSPFRKEEL